MRKQWLHTAAAIGLMVGGAGLAASSSDGGQHITPANCPQPKVLALTVSFRGDGATWRAWFTLTFETGGLGGYASVSAPHSYYDYGDFSAGETSYQLGTDLVRFQGGVREPISVRVETKCGVVERKFTLVAPKGILETKLPGCADYLIIDSRGSGEPKGKPSPPGKAFASAFRQLHRGASVRIISNPYPAVGAISFLGAAIKLPASYHASVVGGKKWLRRKLLDLAAGCRLSTEVYLVGYSQGAQVSADVYQERAWPNVAGMVLFGDPSFNGSDRHGRGNYAPGLDGALHRRPPYAYWRDKTVLSYCHLHDPVCQGIQELAFGMAHHSDYAAYQEPEKAAKYLTYYG